MKSFVLVSILFVLFSSTFAGHRFGPFGNSPSIDVTNITIPIPKDSAAQFGQIISLGSNVYYSIAYSSDYVQSILYQYDINLNLTGTLNLTSIDQYSFIGYSLFGIATSNTLYLTSNHKIVQVNATNLQVIKVLNYTDGIISKGFPSSDGTQFWVFYQNNTDFSTGFLAFSSTTLSQTGFFQYKPPAGYDFSFPPDCQSSPNSFVAYCSVGFHNFNGDVYYVQELSLNNFTVNYQSSYSQYIDVAPVGYQGNCEVWTVYGYNNHGNGFAYNITGFSPSLNVIWSTALPTNTQGVDGLVTVGGSVLVSVTIKTTQGIISGQIYQYNSENGNLQQRYNNNSPYVIKFWYDSIPTPYITQSTEQNLFSFGDTTHNGDPDYLVRWEF